MEADFICTVVVDIPYNDGWSYFSKTYVEKGTLVIVPIGNKFRCGLVIECISNSQIQNLKFISEIIPIVLSKNWLETINFMSKYYHEGIGECALFSLPKYIKQNKDLDLADKVYKLNSIPNTKQKDLVDALKSYTSLDELLIINKKAKEYLKKWDISEKIDDSLIINPSNITLNEQQNNICDIISKQSNFNVNLIHGITGSGKTQVYLNLIQKFISSGQILLMIPEINLTPQLLNTIKEHFDTKIAILNSTLSDKQRAKNWYQAHIGQARIVIGTRLSCLASFANLKLIIIDEEHDSSYKQHEGIRYNARDIAIFRAKIEDIPIVLGSATPSLETYLNAKTNKYLLHTLDKRATNMPLPKVHLIDMKSYTQKQNLACISPIVLQKMHETLQKNQQILLFINRRGFAPVLFCTACNHVFKCKNCSSRLVLHTTNNTLVCHHCNFKQHIPSKCTQCGHEQLLPIGFGTQRLEQTLNDNFSNYKTIRIDSDTIANKDKLEQSLELIKNNKVQIIVGTQILAKGHDFKNLGMVVVLEPDSMLHSPNPRAREQLFAQLIQVAGRSGRHERGDVYIQTNFINEDLYTYIQKHDFNTYADILLKERYEANYFPYSGLAQINAGHKLENYAKQELKNIAILLKDINKELKLNCSIGAVLDNSMIKYKGINRAYLEIENSNKKNLHIILNYATQYLKKLKSNWYIEILP